MAKFTALFLILAVHLYGGLASRIRAPHHTVPVAYAPHVHVRLVEPQHGVHVNPEPHQAHVVHANQVPHQHYVHHQPHVHRRPEHQQTPVRHQQPGYSTVHRDRPNIHYTPYAGGAASRGSGRLSGELGGATGAQSRSQEEQSRKIGVHQSTQLLDDGYNRDSGFHNVYGKVEFGRSGQFDNDGRKNQHQSSLGQHESYGLDRNVADAVAHGQLDGHLGSSADYQNQQQLHGNFRSHHDVIPASAHYPASAGH